jgi:hypothetical protein
MLLFPGTLAKSWEGRLAIYILPLAMAGAAVMFTLGRMHGKDVDRLGRDLKQARALVDQREHERDLAQEELFRRLYEERELNKEKAQFQSQLAEYEKYAAPWRNSRWEPLTRSTILCSASSRISSWS